MTRPAEHARVFGLDVLRALAITLVLFAHAMPDHLGGSSLRRLRESGAVLGVELFFVLSGFLIGGILVRSLTAGRLRRFTDLFAFWRRRWYRTLPNFYLFLLLNGVVALWIDGTDWTAVLQTGLFVQNLAWEHPAFFAEAWSLAVEEWFYFAMPIALLVCARFARPERAVWLGILAFLVVPVALRAAAPAASAWDSQVRTLVVFRFDAIMFGVAGAAVASFWPRLWQRGRHLVWLGVPGAATVFAILLARDLTAPQGDLFRVLLLPLVSLVCFCFLPLASATGSGRGRLAAAVTWLSVISYSVYVSHMLVIRSLRFCWKHLVEPVGFNEGWLPFAARLVLTLGVATAVYRWFEKPMMDLRDRRSGRVLAARPEFVDGTAVTRRRGRRRDLGSGS